MVQIYSTNNLTLSQKSVTNASPASNETNASPALSVTNASPASNETSASLIVKTNTETTTYVPSKSVSIEEGVKADALVIRFGINSVYAKEKNITSLENKILD